VRRTIDVRDTKESDYDIVINTSDVCVHYENNHKPFVHKQRAEIWAADAGVKFDPSVHAMMRIPPPGWAVTGRIWARVMATMPGRGCCWMAKSWASPATPRAIWR